MPRRKEILPNSISSDDKLIANTETDVELKLQKFEEELQNLINQQKMRSSGVVYGYFGWDFKFSTSKS
jgi:hypothetical protein